MRAYHPTCALHKGLLVQPSSTLTDDEGKPLYESFCMAHDPRRSEQKRRLLEEHFVQVAAVLDTLLRMEKPEDRIIWGRWSDGHFYAGRLQEDFRDRFACRVEFVDGYVKVISYADLALSKPSNAVSLA